MRIRFARRAAADLVQIQSYSIERWGEEAAAAYMERLRSAFEKVQLFAHLGSPIVPAFRNARRLLVERHLIIYRVEGSTFVVLRVLHQRQDPDPQM